VVQIERLRRRRMTGPAIARAIDDDTLVLLRSSAVVTMAVVVRLRGSGTSDLAAIDSLAAAGSWHVLLISESPDFTTNPNPPDVDLSSRSAVLRFGGPAAVVLARTVPAE